MRLVEEHGLPAAMDRAEIGGRTQQGRRSTLSFSAVSNCRSMSRIQAFSSIRLL